MALYFLAVEPDPSLSARIKEIQKDFADRFQSLRAFRSFPHLTLIPPFSFEEHQENSLFADFQQMNPEVSPFEIDLRDFGKFEKHKGSVIFLRPLPSLPLEKLRHYLERISPVPVPPQYHPHITVAFRDLTLENFYKAWPEYEVKTFEASFLVEEFGLYKHDGKKWNRIRFKRLT